MKIQHERDKHRNVFVVSWTYLPSDPLSDMRAEPQTRTDHEILITARTKEDIALEIAQDGKYRGNHVSSFRVSQITQDDLSELTGESK